MTANENITMPYVRTFYQPGGPGSRRYFYGLGSQYQFITAMSVPNATGKIEASWLPEPRVPGRWRLTGQESGPPDQPTMSLMFYEKWGGIPGQLTAPGCLFNVYVSAGNCNDLSDFYRGWDGGYLLIASQFRFDSNLDAGARTSNDGAGKLEDSVDASGIALYPVGTLNFAEREAAVIVAEVIDAAWGVLIQCADCGVENDGSRILYGLTGSNIGSPSAPGQIVWTKNRFDTAASTAQITGIGVLQPVFIRAVGSVLIVGVSNGTVFWARLNPDTAGPGAWSSFATGLAVLTDAWERTPGDVFFCGSVGGIGIVSRSYDVTAAPTVNNSTGAANLLNRIHGEREVIVAVGAVGTVYASTNGGESFALKTAPAAVTLTSVRVLTAKRWIVGSIAGNAYITVDGGNTWSVVTALPLAGTGTIRDIIAPTAEVICISHDVTNVASMELSLDGGNTWVKQDATSRVINWPTFQRANRLVAPESAGVSHFVSANYIAVAGLSTSGTDGVLFLGVPSIIY